MNGSVRALGRRLVGDCSVSARPRPVHHRLDQSEHQTLQRRCTHGRAGGAIEVLRIGRRLFGVVDAFPYLIEQRAGQQTAPHAGSDGQRHLSFVPGWNHRQLHRLAKDLRGFPGPYILVGDLNLTAPAVARATRMRLLGQGATFPADKPIRQLDHVFTDDPSLAARHCNTPLMAISDHRPLVVDVVRT